MLFLTSIAAVALVAILLVFFFIRFDAAASGKYQDDDGDHHTGQHGGHDMETIQHFSRALNLSPGETCRMLDEVVRDAPSEIEPRKLYLGNSRCASNRDELRKARITHVLNATSGLPNHFSADMQYLRVPVDDSLDADLSSHLDDAVDWIAAIIDDPYASGAVLVHCQQGVSRSATLVVAFLMRQRGLSYSEAFEFVYQRRWIRPNDSFVQQLKKYDALLESRRSAAAGGVAATDNGIGSRRRGIAAVPRRET